MTSVLQALLSASREARLVRLAAADMLTTAEAARLAGVSKSTVRRWVAEGRCLMVSEPGFGSRFPAWQFAEPLWGAVGPLYQALGTTNGWAMLSFLESPHGAFEGQTARAAIEQGQVSRVVEAALWIEN